jgi:hypothetical protein
MRGYILSTRAFCIVVAAVGLALIAGGCGDDDSEAGASSDEIVVETGSLNKEQFVKQADAICRETIEKVRLAGGAYLRTIERSDTPFATEQQEAPKFVETVLVPEYEKQIDQVSSLGAPSGAQQEVTEVLEALSQGLEEAEAEPVEFLNDIDALGKSEKLAEAYGFKACASI